REFGEDPRWDWAVHVALVEKGFPTAAAVALPARGLTLSTVSPPALPPPVDRAPVLVVSRTRPPAETEIVRAALGGDLLPMGPAGPPASGCRRPSGPARRVPGWARRTPSTRPWPSCRARTACGGTGPAGPLRRPATGRPRRPWPPAPGRTRGPSRSERTRSGR